jgi:hypothetical protein
LIGDLSLSHVVFEPKPAYRAAKTLATQLAGMRFNKSWPAASLLLFERDDEFVAVLEHPALPFEASAKIVDFVPPRTYSRPFEGSRQNSRSTTRGDRARPAADGENRKRR